MKYYIIAGERSGDLHASNLMKALLKKDEKADFRFFGGDYMKDIGGELVVHYNELAFMGFLEVIKNLRTINKYLRLCKLDISHYNPDALILVDYAGFNMKIARYAKQKNFKVFYYISPKVWAWNQGRALKIKKLVDHLFCILPFEVEFYKQFDWDMVTYVGNPVIEAVNNHQVNEHFLAENSIPVADKLIAVLPGSRAQELQYILPVLAEVFQQNPGLHFCVAAVKNLGANAYARVIDLANVSLVFDDTYNLLAHANAAIVTSGTATLETALWDVPQVVIYKTSWFSYNIGKAVVKVNYMSLVNLIAGKELVKELLQHECNATAINKELPALLKQVDIKQTMLHILGNQNASMETASQITELIQ